MLLDYEKLFEPYTADGHTVERSIAWVKKEAAKRGVNAETIDVGIQLFFMEVANGKTYPIDKCPCGCGIDKAGTAITHDMLRIVLEMDREQRIQFAKQLEGATNRGIAGYVTDAEDLAVELSAVIEKKDRQLKSTAALLREKTRGAMKAKQTKWQRLKRWATKDRQTVNDMTWMGGL